MLRNVEKKVAIGAEMLRMVFPSKNQNERYHFVSSSTSQGPIDCVKSVAICSHVSLVGHCEKNVANRTYYENKCCEW